MPAGTAESLQRLRQYSHLFTRYRRAYLLGLGALLLTNVIYMSIPRLLGAAIDALRAGTDRPTLLLYAGAIVALAAAQSVVRVASRLYVLGISRRVDNELKGLLHDKLVRLSPSFFDAVRTGDLMSRMTNDVTLVRALAGPGVLYFVNALLLYFLAIVYMATLSWQLTVIVMLPLPVMAWLVRGMVHEIKQYTLGSREALSHLNTVVQENLTGVQVVKAFALERAQLDKFEAASHEYVGWSLKEAWVRAKMVPLVGMAGGVSSVAVLGLGGWMVVQGTLSLGDLVAFLSYVTMLVFPTVALGWILSLVQRGAAALDRVDEVLQAPETIPEPAPVRDATHDGHRDGRLEGEIHVRELTFSYGEALAPYERKGSLTAVGPPDGAEGAELSGGAATNGRRHALVDVDLEAPPGSYVALVGRVGSGKTTLLKALLRLVEVPPGTVFVDGIDVTEMGFERFRPRMGYVPQDDFLFSTTIAANIAFGKPGAPPDAVEEAARQAGVADDVEGFPRRYDTRVGERGLTLSGGQRQRVALARALLVDPDVLVLDNALSHVDSDTERRILRRLRKRRGLSTVIASSNRLTAVRDADRIYVMDAGRVVASGTHEELIRRGGLYADMHEQQRLSDRLEQL